MRNKRSETVRAERNASTRAISAQHGAGQRLSVTLLLGGVALPGLLEYHAEDDQITFAITRIPRATRPDALC